jgi:hypothetical protein
VVDPVSMAVAKKVFGDLFSKLTSGLVDIVGQQLASVLTKKGSSFRKHISATYERCTKIKTLLNRDKPVELLNQYVHLHFRCEDDIIDDYAFIEQIRLRKRVIITGTGGGGKTIFMKYLWIALFENPQGKIPILIELRRINDFASDRLDDYAYESIVDDQSAASKEAFKRAVKAGVFAFILDGFDEVIVDKRAALEKQILDWSYRCPELVLVVSGRWDDRFAAWQRFSTFHVLPFRKKQVLKLIKKLEYEKAITQRFIRRINTDLFDKHSSFLSNPLLATMMLIMFDQFADVPGKACLFYDQAFDALFSRHDATKEGYRRRMHTGCSIDEFKRYLSYFCLATYYDEKFELTETEALNYIAKGLRVENSEVRPSDFFFDLVESVCILRRDGLVYTFSHRSFQEFFAAYCLARIAGEPTYEVLIKVVRRTGDEMIKMLFDMNRELVDTQFIVPRLKRLIEALGDKASTDCFAKWCALVFDSILFFVSDVRPSLLFCLSDWGYFVNAVSMVYPDQCPLSVPEGEPFLDAIRILSERCRRHGASWSLAVIRIEGSGQITLFGRGVSREASDSPFKDLNKLRHPSEADFEFTEPAPWFGETAFAQHLRNDAASFIALLSEIKKDQRCKNKAIDVLLGLS